MVPNASDDLPEPETPREHDERVARNVDVDVLQVVGAPTRTKPEKSSVAMRWIRLELPTLPRAIGRPLESGQKRRTGAT